MELRVAACQILTYPEPDRSADKVTAWMEQAARDDVAVVAFPEACLVRLPQRPRLLETGRPRRVRQLRAAGDGRRRRSGSGRHPRHRSLGGGGGLFNSLPVIDRDGAAKGRYAKTHLAENWPSPGRRLPLYEVAGVPSSFIICHDVRYPELVRLPAIAGARICYFCSNESGLLQEHKFSAYRAMPIARATENSIYLVMANAPANPKDVGASSQSHGNSKIVHPGGNVMAEAGHFEEGLIAANLDMDAATGAMARRSVEDTTVLQQWMRDGSELVDRSGE